MKRKSVHRRDFLRTMGIFSAAFCASRLPVIAGPFTTEDFQRNLMPADKKLNPEWVKSLFERGAPAVYTKSRNELKFIGMPAGGISSGTLYAGGDGRLWLWDIFNRNQNGVVAKTAEYLGKPVNAQNGANYVEPSLQESPLEQGFAIKLVVNGNTMIRQFRETDWKEISFSGTYPIATVTYRDDSLPLTIIQEIYSPFIPLDADHSSLPATVLSFSVKNESDREITVILGGWLQNAAGLYSGLTDGYTRVNRRYRDERMTAVHFLLEAEGRDHPVTDKGDYGSMCIAAIGGDANSFPSLNTKQLPGSIFEGSKKEDAVRSSGDLLTGGVKQSLSIPPGLERTCHFAISWYFPNSGLPVTDAKTGNYYAKKFTDALSVARYVAMHFEHLSKNTHLWRDTWYDSTLPYWFLDRTFYNTCTLATATCHRFATGRFWAWEGVGCCEGTCTHVWQYAQAPARLFPSIERDTRERVDLGVAFDKKTGMIGYRGEHTGPAIDGQAGTVLRIYREHLMSADRTFLKTNWPHIKGALEFILNHDSDKDGIIDGAQHNTLDAAWYGGISWISSLCLAAIRAGEEMAKEMRDTGFALQCRSRFEKGKQNIEKRLFNGEYFIQKPDPSLHKRPLGSYDTCEIDQVFGQSWAWQAGLGRILDKDKTLSALRSLWKYNYTPDVGPYIGVHKGGRPYALAGEGGMLMDTNPRKDLQPYGDDIGWQVGYFNECMSGFEHQVASHMIAEGMLEEGFVMLRTIHDRYHPSRRNPFNEIECSDHYARAMASYGSFISVCGFEYHGPEGYLAFSPRIHPEDFKAPFTVAEGWGSFTQKRKGRIQHEAISLKYGRLTLRSLAFEVADTVKIKEVSLTLNGRTVAATVKQSGSRAAISLTQPVLIRKGESLNVIMS